MHRRLFLKTWIAFVSFFPFLPKTKAEATDNIRRATVEDLIDGGWCEWEAENALELSTKSKESG